MNVITTSMEAAFTSASTSQEITAVPATMALCWLTMATTAWVRSVRVNMVAGDVKVTVTASLGGALHQLGISGARRSKAYEASLALAPTKSATHTLFLLFFEGGGFFWSFSLLLHTTHGCSLADFHANISFGKLAPKA